MLLNQWVCRCPLCHAWPLHQRDLPWCESCEHIWQRRGHEGTLDPRLLSAIEGCSYALPFDWPWHEPIRRFKLLQDTGWSHAWGRLMGQTLIQEQAQSVQWDWIGMPQTPHRWAQRGGYDPVALMIEHTRTWLRSQGMVLGPWRKHALHKHQTHQRVQHSLGRHERWLAVNDAFAWSDDTPYPTNGVNGNALLVDDILTTGATLTAAARVLKKAGYSRIWALTLARTPAPDWSNQAQFGAFRDHHVSHRSGST